MFMTRLCKATKPAIDCSLIGKLDVLERCQSGFDLRDDGSLVFARDVYCQAVGLEDVTEVLREIGQSLVDVCGRVDPLRHRLKLLLESEPIAETVLLRERRLYTRSSQAPRDRGGGLLADPERNRAAHSLKTWLFRSICGRRSTTRDPISSMMRSASRGFRCVM